MRLAFALAEARFWLRNAGSYIGIFWYVLEPLVFFLILIFLQTNVGASSIPEYPAYLLLGLIMVNFFIGATTGAVRSMRDNNGLIQSVTVDTEAVPLSAVIQFIFSHAFELVLFIIVALLFHDLSWHIIWYPVIFSVYVVFVSGSAFILATLGVFIEDLFNIWAVASRLLWLGTPIFYSLSPGNPLYVLNRFNPLYYFITYGRDLVVYGVVPDPAGMVTLVFGSIATLAVGVILFSKNKRKFGEFL